MVVNRRSDRRLCENASREPDRYRCLRAGGEAQRRPNIFVAHQPFKQSSRLDQSIRRGIGLDAADEMAHDLRPVDQMRPQHVRRDQCVGQVDLCLRRDGSDKELYQY